LIAAHPRLELLAPIVLDIACFRYNRADWMAQRRM
jgi:hypothetical protein